MNTTPDALRSSKHLAVLVGVTVLILSSVWTAPVRADLTGKWRMRLTTLSYSEFVDVTQVGSTVTFSFFSWTFTGTISGNILDADAPPQGSFGPTHLRAIVSPDETLLPGAILTSLMTSAGELVFFGDRCGCFDANAVNGDGCSNLCQVEECYSCSGAPSVCVPAADGTPCEDGLVCTDGETCTGGSCGGGSPIVSCVDLNGHWLLHDYFPEFASESDRLAYYRQTDSFLMESASPSAAVEFAGPIDPATGVYSLKALFHDDAMDFNCPDPFDEYGGQSTDSVTLSAYGTNFLGSTFYCYEFAQGITGSRCGGGTLDPGEECDDGNGTPGDGCDASCAVEPCYACDTAEPSNCSPDDGQPCDDGNGCTTGDACQGGSCTATPDDGAPCDDGDACTTGDTCQGGSCAAGNPVVCEPCLACAPTGTCEPAPRAACRESIDPERTLLVLRHRAVDQVTWKWVRGAVTTLQDLGEPVVVDDYTMCIFDESGPTPELLFRATASAGGTCGTAPCWEPISDNGFSYRDDTAAGDGLSAINVKSGEEGRARAVVKGKGSNLSNRPYGFPVPPLPLPLRVQLQAQTAECFESYFTNSGVIANDPGGRRFKARGTASP